MCGIVGAVSTRDIVPILVEGLKRLEYRGYDSCGVAVHQHGELRRTRSTSRGGRARCARWRTTHRRRHRHRPHALGHARRAGGAQRAPAFLQRPHCARAQRHHREPRRAARRAAGQGLQVREPDRHRGRRPPGQPSVRRRSVRCRAARCAALEGLVCAGGVLPRRAAPRGRRARRLAADRGRGQAARTSWPPTRWRWPA